MRVILYTGKGGVGKTTVAAATAVACAKLGHRTLIISTDAAHSLGDSFDMELGDHPTEVAHNLDAQLSPIEGKSREGFVFKIDLQVQIHVPDTRAPKVISMVGTMQNLVNEVLQAAVGNHFRNTIQNLEAVRFIDHRIPLEASGGVRFNTIRAIAETGVVFISTSRITQAAPAVDIGLDEA